MITEFNKSGSAATYRRRFAECIDKADYEGAFVVLIKFSEENENPEFHLACGMLYILMTQESEEPELTALAVRESLCYIIDHPDCRSAYRNILAAAAIDGDPVMVKNATHFISEHGYDIDEMLAEFETVGIGAPRGEYEFDDIITMFEPGEFGAIECERKPINSSPESQKKCPPGGNIIKFRGAQKTYENSKAGEPKKKSAEAPADMFDACEDSPIAEFESIIDTLSDIGIDLDGKTLSISDQEGSVVISDERKHEISISIDIHRAERCIADKDFDKAFSILERVMPSDGYLYYCAMCMRAFMYLEQEKMPEARRAIDIARGKRQDGALAGTLLCRWLELSGQGGEIPDVLKNIDVTDYADCDHVLKAMVYAIEFCSEQDALELAEEYIDEFNSMDLRMLYAQMLYNSGERERATHELYVLSKLYYDDFTAYYFYLMAKMKTERMPVELNIPTHVIGALADNIISISTAEPLDDAYIASDTFAYSLEVFLTLEFDNTRTVTNMMFEALHALARDERLEKKMREALVSPYVEPIVKAVILSELLKRGGGFVISSFGAPADEGMYPPEEWYTGGYLTAFAFVLVLSRDAMGTLRYLTSLLRDMDLSAKLKEEELAFSLIREVARRDGEFGSAEGRICFALGFKTKAAAEKAYKKFNAVLDE